MARTSIALAALLIAALPLGCAHGSDASGTTTVTSGATPVGRVTGSSPKEQAAMRLADEICAREAACGAIGKSAKYPTEEACMAEEGASAPAQISRWSCTPTETQAGFEECLAAIRSERCATPLPRVDRLIACRSVSVCGK